MNRINERGLSLIEALVAMAVMAFGMLGVLGMQATLRSNGDIAKQRSEAVRIAQAAMETQRAFSVMQAASAATSYASIVNQSASTAAQANANTTFERVVAVSTPGAASAPMNLAARKHLVVDVSWADRNNATQAVRLSSIVAGVAPELMVALSVPGAGSVMQNPGGRKVSIPISAVDLNNGSSRFVPPGGALSGVSWIFSNTTGFITQVCAGTVCDVFLGRLLSGYVRFATSVSFPDVDDSRTPPDTSVPSGVGVSVALTAPAVSTVSCFAGVPTGTAYLEYFCALPIDGTTPFWSGRSTLSGLTLAGSVADPTDTANRVCRYTSVRTNDPSVALPDEEHPYTYTVVSTSLLNQNFLVTKAGNGSSPYLCPNDSSPLGRTMDHQPAS